MQRALLLLVLALTPAAFAGSAADPGVYADALLIGGTAPLTGEAAAAAAASRGAAAYFRYVNARGGVNGRTIAYKVLDDEGDPQRTAAEVRRLVEQDHVFALFGTPGTSNNLAIRDLLNQRRIPQLFVASGATTWGRDATTYPWTIGYVPTYRTEATILARQVLKTEPRARIAVLYAEDDDGEELVADFRRGLGTSAQQIVSALGYDPTADVSAEVAAVRQTTADTLVILGSGSARRAMTQVAKLRWRPRVYLNAAATFEVRAVTNGAVSTVFFKNPSDPQWSNDPGITLLRTIATRYGGAKDLRNSYYVAGMASAFTLVDALKKAGRALTRRGVMTAARSLQEANNPFVLPGIVIRTSRTDASPMDEVALQRWSGGHWNVLTGPLTSGS